MRYNIAMNLSLRRPGYPFRARGYASLRYRKFAIIGHEKIFTMHTSANQTLFY